MTLPTLWSYEVGLLTESCLELLEFTEGAGGVDCGDLHGLDGLQGTRQLKRLNMTISYSHTLLVVIYLANYYFNYLRITYLKH